MKSMRFIFLVLILLLMFVAGFYIYAFRQNPTQEKYNINTDSTAIVLKLQSLDRFETASFTIEKVIDAGTSSSDLKEFFFGDRLLLIAHGEVIAGFDLSTLSKDDIVVESKNVTITLPKPLILLSKLDNDKTRVYDRRQGLLTKGDKDLESEARLAAEESILEAACSGGVLDEASKNGRTQLTALLKALGFTTVVINIPLGEC